MSRLIAALHKECLLLVRDLPGLGILFLMPLLLVLVVTLAQENALKSQVEKSNILLYAESGSVLGRQVREDMEASGMYTVEGDSAGPERLLKAIQTGEYPLGIIVESGDTAIILVIDPALHQAYSQSLITATTFILKGAGGKVVIQQILASTGLSDPVISTEAMLEKLPPVHLVQAIRDRSTIKPTPVQNNIPGFILFAMFFIVIPLSGSIISERNEGTALRLGIIPVSPWYVMGAKVLLYLLVCIIQFILMMLAGHFILHLVFGFPRLEIASSIAALSVATVSAAMGAVGFGVMVGAGLKTHNQAALFGSVIVVVLGVISGTFLPIHVMPGTIRAISSFSPMRWGIDNYLELFIRDGTLEDILPRAFWLLLFFIFAMIISTRIFSKQR